MLPSRWIANYRKYGPDPSTHDLLKFAAIAIMIADHVGYFFFPQNLWLRVVGRITVPIWLFMAGYTKPSREGLEIPFLSWLMILSAMTFKYPLFPINILASIWISRRFAKYLQKQPQDLFTTALYILVLVATMPATIEIFEYGSLALLFAMAGHYYRNGGGKRAHIAMILAYAAFQMVERYVFKFDILQSALVAAGTGIVCWLLANFKLEYVPLSARFPATAAVINFFARNSLYIYVLHYISFEIAARIFFNAL